MYSLNSFSIVSKSSVNNANPLDNILNFVKTAQEIQKLLQDKEQIDEYKNQIIQLQNENLQLKNKLGLVNRIIKDKGNVDEENEIIEDSTPFII